jgi:hypothetical protein
LTFESRPLDEPLDLFGNPSLRLRLSVDRPWALVFARLCSVAPDGTSYVLTRGALNLTHRDGHERPSPVEPGKRYDVAFPLDVAGERIPAGHSLRLAISTTYWPWLWPSPEPVELSLETGAGSWLDLPVRSAAAGDGPPPGFGEPEDGVALATESESGDPRTEITHDAAAGTYVVTYHYADLTERLLDQGLEIVCSDSFDRHSIREDDPLSARVDSQRKVALSRGDWKVAIETRHSMTCSATHFRVVETLEAFEADRKVFDKSWDRTFPRDHG